ncbi:hypothetical protein P9112_005228 [Eukaryota sp. TZLM1-RC]
MFFGLVRNALDKHHFKHPQDALLTLVSLLHQQIISNDLKSASTTLSMLLHSPYLLQRLDLLYLAVKGALHLFRSSSPDFSTVESFFRSVLEFISNSSCRASDKITIRRFVLAELCLFTLHSKSPYDALTFLRSIASDAVFDSSTSPLRGYYGTIAAMVLSSPPSSLPSSELQRLRHEAHSNLTHGIQAFPDCQLFIEAAVWLYSQDDDTESVSRILGVFQQSARGCPNAWRLGVFNQSNSGNQSFDDVINDVAVNESLVNLLDQDPFAVDALELATEVAFVVGGEGQLDGVFNILDRLLDSISFDLCLEPSMVSMKIWSLLLKILEFLNNLNIDLTMYNELCSWWKGHFFNILNYQHIETSPLFKALLEVRLAVFKFIFKESQDDFDLIVSDFDEFMAKFTHTDDVAQKVDDVIDDASSDMGSDSYDVYDSESE